ncbi:MAG: hypothetical protein QOF58_977 [Pseudonocardiales bacterium]|nr:hypothetical protein [Pseudonocardiales bacterium]
MLMFDAVVPVTAGNTAAPGGGTAGTAKFSVDPDQAQKMVDGLQKAVDTLVELQRKGQQLQQSGAPGPDPYSGWATLSMRQAAGDQAGGYAWANQAAQKALEQTIKNIQKALAKYRGTDEAAQTALKG